MMDVEFESTGRFCQYLVSFLEKNNFKQQHLEFFIFCSFYQHT